MDTAGKRPRRLRAKYTPRTKLRFVQGVFRSCGGPASLSRRRRTEAQPETARRFPVLSHRCGGVTTYGGRETKDKRTEVNDGTAQLYPDVEAV